MKSLLRTLLLFICGLAPALAQERTVILSINDTTIHAEIAVTQAEREHGLMGRSDLCADCGMLFVFDTPARYAFWMKNTPTPLSIAFIDAGGRIINLDEMEAETETPHYAQGDALYALEMQAGWFTKHEVKTGDQIIELHAGPK
jgi:uncharacterized membrane protein (UPF0127 family)